MASRELLGRLVGFIPRAVFFSGAMSEYDLLSDVPSYLSITQMFKASPAEEGGQRFVYLEASNEVLDQQGEVVLAKALAESADYFLRYGNLDLDHITQIGAKGGISDYPLYEIGRPVDVKVDGSSTFVKGQVYQGDGPVADKANQFWDSLTRLNPPQRWYPSVGGAVLEKGIDTDPETGAKRAIIRKVRWTNIGFSKTPVNADVPTVSTVPFGALAKSWGPCGLDIGKALEAGYGTDVATLTDGGALRRESLYGAPTNYWDFRERLAADMRGGKIVRPDAAKLVDHAARHYGLDRAGAAQWVERFIGELRNGLKRRRQ